jgi:hypothetical protein
MFRFAPVVVAVMLSQCLVPNRAALGAEPAAILPPIPSSRPESPLMLDLVASGTDPAKIDFASLATLPGEHAVIDRGDSEWQFRLHNYLAHYDGKFWCFWSHGPFIEDQARQHLRYATSYDGLQWSKPQVLAGPPHDGYGYIARDFWIREGDLIALASLYEAPAFHDGDLELVAFRWHKDDAVWQPAGRVFDNALNNFAPEKIASGEWMMSRRASDRSVSMLIGGVKAIDDWQDVPFSAYRLPGGGAPEEPHCWMLPGGALVGLFRDNSKSGRLLRSFSIDNGRSWTPVVRTNFPDATSKFHGLRTSRGYWAMASNANPHGRHPLCLSISPDGLVFTHLFRLPLPENLAGVAWARESQPGEPQSVQYPHVLEHDGALYISYSRKKQTVEVVRVPLMAIDKALGNK